MFAFVYRSYIINVFFEYLIPDDLGTCPIKYEETKIMGFIL